MIAYLSPEQILHLHELQTRRFGGSGGVRDRGAVDAAVSRPRMTFGGEDLYRDLADKAGAMMHSLLQIHPFVDGKKRVGAMAMELFLLVNGHELVAADDDLEELTLSVARGELAAEAIAIWIRQRLRARQG